MADGRIYALVADDDPISRGIVAEQLLRLGIGPVRSAGSGLAALKELQSSPEIRLLVTDLKMPDMDGIALLRQLDSLNRPISVIIMSALGDKILRAAATIGIGHKLHILGISNKPVSLRHLSKLIASIPSGSSEKTSQQDPAAQIDPEDISEALNNGGYFVVAQPELDLRSDKFAAVEILSRWSHPKLSQHSPGDVIMAAEKSQVIHDVMRHTLTQAGKAWKVWGRAGLSPKISINLSHHNIADPDFPDWVSAEIAKYSLSPQDIVFEITETAMPTSGTTNLEVAFRLGLRGFRLSIDDFGTGHSNLRQLQDMPFHQLKIDKSFVDQLEDSFETRTIIESSLQMARNLGLSTVAEGVERKEQLHILRDMGCDLVQGYLFAKPMRADELVQWAKAQQQKEGAGPRAA